jgi:hypothetical protein
MLNNSWDFQKSEVRFSHFLINPHPLIFLGPETLYICGHAYAYYMWLTNKLFNLSFFRNETLFTYESIISMCSLESTRLRSPPQFKDLCETKGPAHCCPGWSLGGYIGIMNNRSSCFNIRVRLTFVWLFLKFQIHWNIFDWKVW